MMKEKPPIKHAGIYIQSLALCQNKLFIQSSSEPQPGLALIKIRVCLCLWFLWAGSTHSTNIVQESIRMSNFQ